MPRVGRAAPGGVIFHVLNRGNGRARVFQKRGDYAAFELLLAEVGSAVPVRPLVWCLTPFGRGWSGGPGTGGGPAATPG